MVIVQALQVRLGSSLAKQDGARRIPGDELLQLLAPQGGKGATAIGAIERSLVREGGMLAAHITKFDPRACYPGVFFRIVHFPHF